MELKIASIQPHILWEDIDGNLAAYSEEIGKIKDPFDVLFLPELFTTGFSMNTALLAEPMHGKSMKWMEDIAGGYNCCVAGSLMIEQDGNHYNRMVWMQPDGQYHCYDKRHLFQMGNEEQYYTAGKTLTHVELCSFRIRLLICYDLRFPVWSRNRQDYDLLVYLANWPAARHDAWISLLKARAIENQSYVMGLNRVGRDGAGIEYAGNSLVYDAKGNITASLPLNRPGTLLTVLSLDELRNFRKKFPVWQDADSFNIE